MKKSFIYALSVILLGASFLFSSCSQTLPLFAELDGQTIDNWGMAKVVDVTSEDIGLKKMELIAENERFRFYYNTVTCEIALQNKADNHIWFSNPQDRMNDGGTGGLFSNQLEVMTLDRTDVPKTWNNYNDSVVYGQFKTNKIKDGIRITYLFGELKQQGLFPSALSVERYQELLNNINNPLSKTNFQMLYSLISLKNVDSPQMQDTLKKTYPILNERDIYVLKTGPSKLEKDNLTRILQEIGYTYDDKIRDLNEIKLADDGVGNNHIQIDLVYTLEEDGLRAEVPVSSIRTTSGLKVAWVSILKYWGSSRSDGYYLVPSGSGAVIDFDVPVSPSLPDYTARIYGDDISEQVNEKTSKDTPAYFPIYGIVNGSSGCLAVIESGAATATVQARGTGLNGQYPFIAAKFNTVEYAAIPMEASPNSVVNFYAKEPVADDACVKFIPTGGSYTQIAIEYRNYLRNHSQLGTKSVVKKAPLVVGLIGAVDDTRSVIGIQRNVVLPLTTFEQAQIISNELLSKLDYVDLSLSYAGWRKGGIRSGTPSSADSEAKLGGNNALRKLLSFTSEKEIPLFLEWEPAYVFKDNVFDDFKKNRDGVKYITGAPAQRMEYNTATFITYGTAFILKPWLIQRYADRFLPDFKKLGGNDISLSSLGSELYSDFDPKHFSTRNKTMEDLSKLVSDIDKKGFRLMADGCNSYLLAALHYAVNIPDSAGSHPMLTYCVPFTQIVLSGSVAYTAEPINLAADFDWALLKAIETGSGLYFSCFAADPQTVKDTAYDSMYTHSYYGWREPVVRASNTLGKALKDVYGYCITGHELVAEGVYKTTYENGKSIYVNYNKTPVTIDGATIDGMNYFCR